MAVLEDINATLEANQELLTNLQDDQEKLVTLVQTLVDRVQDGGVITLSEAQELLTKVQGQKTQLEQLNVTQDAALEAGESSEDEPDPTN